MSFPSHEHEARSGTQYNFHSTTGAPGPGSVHPPGLEQPGMVALGEDNSSFDPQQFLANQQQLSTSQQLNQHAGDEHQDGGTVFYVNQPLPRLRHPPYHTCSAQSLRLSSTLCATLRTSSVTTTVNPTGMSTLASTLSSYILTHHSLPLRTIRMFHMPCLPHPFRHAWPALSLSHWPGVTIIQSGRGHHSTRPLRTRLLTCFVRNFTINHVCTQVYKFRILLQV